MGQAEQSLGVVFTHTEKDELKESHAAASTKKRERKRGKKKQPQRSRRATINDLVAGTSAATHVGRNTNLPFLSLGELRKKGTRAEASLLPLRRRGQAEREGGRERGA